jgi:stage II sporulation protein E
LERERTARLLGWGIRLFLAAALTATRTAGGYAPFALGLLAAAGPGADGAAALVGTALGALLFLDFSSALPHLAVAVLLLTAATAFQGISALTRPKVLASTAAGLFLAVNGIYVLQALSPMERVAPCLAAAALTGVSAWFFRPLLRPDEARSTADSVLFLAAALLLALSDLELLGLSLGRILLCVLLAYTAYDRGSTVGAAAGLGLGLTADL